MAGAVYEDHNFGFTVHVLSAADETVASLSEKVLGSTYFAAVVLQSGASAQLRTYLSNSSAAPSHPALELLQNGAYIRGRLSQRPIATLGRVGERCGVRDALA